MATTWYYLINTMSKTEATHAGRVLSRHKTDEAAIRADGRLQRATVRGGGDNAHVPTIIRSSDIVHVEAGDAWWIPGLETRAHEGYAADTSVAIATLDSALAGTLGKEASTRAHAWLARIVGDDALLQLAAVRMMREEW